MSVLFCIRDVEFNCFSVKRNILRTSRVDCLRLDTENLYPWIFYPCWVIQLKSGMYLYYVLS